MTQIGIRFIYITVEKKAYLSSTKEKSTSSVFNSYKRMSVTTITASTNSSVCGSTNASRRHLRLKRNHIIFGTEKKFLSHQCVQNYPFTSPSDISGQRNTRVEAGWFFKGGGEQGSDASLEHSDSANEDILIFFYQLDLATRVQVFHILHSLYYYYYCYFIEISLICLSSSTPSLVCSMH